MHDVQQAVLEKSVQQKLGAADVLIPEDETGHFSNFFLCVHTRKQNLTLGGIRNRVINLFSRL